MSILIIYICYLNNQYSFIKSIFLYNIRLYKFNHLFDWVLNFTGRTSGSLPVVLFHHQNQESHEHLVLQHYYNFISTFSPSVRTLISFSLYVCITFLCSSPTTRWRLFLTVLSFVFCFQYFWIEVLISLPSRGWFSFQVHFFNRLAR